MCIFVLQDKRISCADALTHPYMDEGRLRYHSCMCRCCQNTPAGRQYVADFEPVSPHIFDDCFEKDLTSVHQVKGNLFFMLLYFNYCVKMTFMNVYILDSKLSIILKICLSSYVARKACSE